MSPKERTLPRGIRNNNPLNIRIGNTWLGERANPTDTQFEEFISIEYGYRAAFCILRRYIKRYHFDTVSRIISSWAPPSENQTTKYIDRVCAMMGVDPTTQLRFEDETTMVKLAAAMTVVECGRAVPEDKILRGYQLA